MTEGQVVEEVFTVETVDGTTEVIKVRITGVNDTPVIVAEGYTLESIIPDLTSNNDQGIEVTASGYTNNNYLAYMALDGVKANEIYDTESWAAPGDTAWFQVDLGSLETVLQYSITGIDAGSRAPKNWELLGSNDGTTFDVIDTQSDETNWSPYETRLYQLDEVASYQYYRINILQNNGDNYQGFDGFQLFALSEASALSVDENSQVTLDVVANDTDKDQGDSLSLVSADVVNHRGEVVVDQGTVTIVDNKLVYNAALAFESLAQDQEAYVSIRYVIQDSEGAQVESSTLIKVTGVNDTPEFEHRSISIDEGETVVLSSVHLSVDDVDSDSANFVYTLSELSLVTAAGATDNGDGTYTFTQAQLDAGEISLIHNGSNDAPSLKVEVTDGVDSTSIETFAVIFAAHNDEPVTSLVDLGNTDEDVNVTFTEVDLLANATDAEGDKLAVHHVRLVDETQGEISEVSEGVWELTPTEHFNGDNVQIEYDIHDYALVNYLDFSQGVGDFWTVIGDYEAHPDGGSLGASPSGTPIIETDAILQQDGIQSAIDTSLGLDHTVTVVLAQRPSYSNHSIEIVWDGVVIQTITPATTAWETIVVDLPYVDKDSTDLIIREPAAQNDGVGVRVDSVSIYTDALSTVTGTAEIDITAVDDAPDVAAVDLGVIKEDNPLVFSASDLLAGVTDVDSANLNVTTVALADDAEGSLNVINSLVFLEDTDNAIKVNGTLPELDQFTLAFDYISTGTNSAYDPLFSLATSSVDNALTIEASREAGNVKIYIDGESHLFKGLNLNDGQLQVFAVSWNSEIGALKLYNNGVLHDETIIKQGGTIAADGLAFVGQEQDSYGGGFDAGQVMTNAAMHRMTLLSEEMPAEIIGLSQPLSFFSNEVELDIQSVDGVLFDGAGKHTLEKIGSIVQVPSYYVYSPTEHYASDNVEINFSVSDGANVVEGVATVNVEAVNDSPVTTPVDLGTVSEGNTKVITQAELLAQTTDIEGAELSVGHVRLRDPQYGSIVDNGDGTWTLTPADNLNVTDVQIDFDIVEDTPVSYMDFTASQLAEGWTSVGKEIHGDGGALGSSATSTPLMDLDSDGATHDSLSYTLDMSNDTAYRLALSMRERNADTSDTVEILLDGQLIATFIPEADFEEFEVDIEPTGNPQAVLTIQEKADQSDGNGAVIDTVSIQVMQEGTATIDITPVNDAPVLVAPEYDTLAAYDFASTEELSGRANDATFGAGATHTAEGVTFNSAGGEIGELHMGGAITIATTFTYHSYQSWVRILDFGNGPNNDNLVMGTTSSGQIRVHIYKGASDRTELFANDAYTLGEEFHLTYTIDDTGYHKLYIDGVLVAEEPNGYVPNDLLRTSNKIGASNWSADANTDGQMNDLIIIDRAIDANEVQALYDDVSAKDFSRFKLLSDIDEHSANGTVVGTVQAMDEDSETLTYSLEDDAGGRFVIDSATGEISVADGSLLDYDVAAEHSVTVKVSDGELDDTQTYQIMLKDVNEAPVLGVDLSMAISAQQQLDLANETNNQSATQIIQLTDGNYIAAWLEDNQEAYKGVRIMAQKLDADLNKVGGVIQLSGGDVTGDDYLHNFALEALSNGGFASIYQRHNPGISWNGRLRIFDNEGNAVTNEIDTGSQFVSSDLVSLDDGSVILVGSSPSHVIFKHFDALGNHVKDIDPTITKNAWHLASAELLSNDTLVYVGRTSETGTDAIYVYMYDLENSAVVHEFSFGGAPANSSTTIHTATLANGDLVVLYNSGDHLYAQRISDTGGLVGDAQQINQGSYYEKPMIVALADGGMLIAWSEQDVGAEADFQTALFVQRFDDTLSAIGSPQVVANMHEPLGVHMVVTDSGDVKITYHTHESGVYDVQVHSIGTQLISRLSENGTVVGQVEAHDFEADTLTYELTDDAGGRFAIDPNDGIIYVKDNSLLNEDVEASHTVTVKVTDEHGLSETQHYTLNLQPVQDAPVIEGRASVPVFEADTFAHPDSFDHTVSGQAAVSAFKTELAAETTPFHTHDTINVTVEDGAWDSGFVLPNDPSFEGKLFVFTNNAGLDTSVEYEGKSLVMRTGEEVTFRYSDGHWYSDLEANALTEDAVDTLTFNGKLSIDDSDAGESAFVAETVAGLYGDFTIDAAGNWSYSADNNQQAINALSASQTLKLDGTQHVTINDDLIKADHFTISLWVKPEDLSQAYIPIFGAETPDAGILRSPSLFISNNVNSGALHWDSYDNSATRYAGDEGTDIFREGEWTQITWVKDAEEYRFYADGQQVASANAPAEVHLKDYIQLGKLHTNVAFNGELDDVQTYSRALTDTEILDVYEGNAQPDLLSRFEFEGHNLQDVLTGEKGDQLVATASGSGVTSGSRVIEGDQESGDSQTLKVDTSSYLSVDQDLVTSDNFSISLWVKPEDIHQSYIGFFGGLTAGSSFRAPTLFVSNVKVAGGLALDSYDAANGTRYLQYTDNAVFEENQWTHITWTKQGVEYKLYADGELIATMPAPADVRLQGNTPIAHDQNHPFSGEVDDVQTYSRALTADEVKAVMDGHVASDLIAHFDFEGDQPDEIYADKSAYQVSATDTLTADSVGVKTTFLKDSAVVKTVDGTEQTLEVMIHGIDDTLEVSLIDPDDELVAAYDFESTGELVSQQESLTFTGSAALGETAGNGHLVFDGTSSAVRAEGVTLGGDMTISLWYKMDSITSPYTGVFKLNNAGNADVIKINGASGNDLSFRVYDGPTPTVFFVLNDVIDLGEWTHLVTTIDELGNYRFYKNGELFREATHAYIPSTLQRDLLSFGENDSSNMFDGAMDAASLYDRALTAEEVSALYQTSHVPLHKIEATVFGDAALSVTASLPETHLLGDNFWMTFTDRGKRIGIQLQIQDNNDGSLKLQTVQAKSVDLATWDALTELEKQTYFDTNGTAETLATEEGTAGYGIKDVSVNGSLSLPGIVDDVTGINVIEKQINIAEHAVLPSYESLSQIDFTMHGLSINHGQSVDGSLLLPSDYDIGQTFWVSVSNGHQKAVQLQTVDSGDGTFHLKAIQAKYADAAIWNALTYEEKYRYFDSNGTSIALATAEGQHGYGVRDVAFNGSPPVVTGVIDDNTGTEFSRNARDPVENGDLIASVKGRDADAEQLNYQLIDDAGGRFNIDHETGDIFVADASRLNYEDQASHTLVVEVKGGTSRAIEFLQIHLSDLNGSPTVVTGRFSSILDQELVNNGELVDLEGWTLENTIQHNNGWLQFGWGSANIDGVASYTLTTEANLNHELSFDLDRIGFGPNVTLRVEVIDVNSGTVLMDRQATVSTLQRITQDFTSINDGDILLSFSDQGGNSSPSNTDIMLDNVSVIARSEDNTGVKAELNVDELASGLAGQSYQLALANEEQSLFLLEPVHKDGEVYYWLDVNQDNALTVDDQIDAAELAQLMENGTTLSFAEADIALIDGNAMDALQTNGTIPEVPVWTVANNDGAYSLNAQTDELTQGYVMYQIIG